MGWRWCHSLVWVWLSSHSCEISPVLPPWNYPTSGIRANGLRLGQIQFDPCIESLHGGGFQANVSHISVWTAVQVGSLWGTRVWGGSVPMWKGLSLEGKIVRYTSVSLSFTFSRSEKVEQHIRKKTHKPNALRFWIEGGVIPLCVFDSVPILARSFRFWILEIIQSNPCCLQLISDILEWILRGSLTHASFWQLFHCFIVVYYLSLL